MTVVPGPRVGLIAIERLIECSHYLLLSEPGKIRSACQRAGALPISINWHWRELLFLLDVLRLRLHGKKAFRARYRCYWDGNALRILIGKYRSDSLEKQKKAFSCHLFSVLCTVPKIA
jgi:hypothetical protein